MHPVFDDLQHSIRSLPRSPGFTLVAALTLALGIGANTAIFSAVSAVMLRPLPYGDADRLVALWEENADFHWYEQDAAPANYLDWREQVGALRDVAAYEPSPGTTTLTGYGEPRLLSSLGVTGNFFDVLGVRAARGRVLRDEETWYRGGTRVAVLSYRAWRDVFGSDPGLVNRTIRLGSRPVEVVGILPANFAIPGLEAEIFRPVLWDRSYRTQAWFRRAHFLRVVGRVKPGVSLPAANAELQAVVARLERDYPATNTHMGAGMTPLHDFLVGKTRRPLFVLLGAVTLLLLIACANVANLLLVRAASREREAAVRLALGAPRWRLVLQALTESLVLSALGGSAGLLLGWWGTHALAGLQPAGLLPVRDLVVDRPVLAYAMTATVLCGIVFGIAPALWMGGRAPASALKEEGRGLSAGRRTRRLGDALVVGEVALALALALGAGLLVRSYLLLRHVDPGFDAHGVLAVSVNLPAVRYDSMTKVVGFYEELRQRARALPGAQAAAIVSQLPATQPPWSSEFSIADRGEGIRGAEVVHREISPDYQAVMRVPLVGGRLLTEADRQGPAVVLVNQALVQAYFRGEDPVGRRVTFDRVPTATSYWRTIVGVVGDETQGAVAQGPQPEFLAPYQQEARSNMTLVLRTALDPVALAPAVRRILKDMDPDLAVTSIETMEDVLQTANARDRFLTTLFLAFGGVGVVLAMVGVYGVVSQRAGDRTREMGIRLALGARAPQVQWLVLRRGVALTAAGAAGGVAVGLIASQLMRAMLYRVAPVDPATFTIVPALLVLAAMVAAWLPASRASRAHPADVLRAQ